VGPPRAGFTLADPIVSILWGVLVFHEQIRSGWYLALAVVAGLVMVAGVFALARSPLLEGEPSETDEAANAGQPAAVPGFRVDS